MISEYIDGSSNQHERLLRQYSFQLMRKNMERVGRLLEASDPSAEVIFQGAMDTGTIQTSADIDASSVLLSSVRVDFPGSFSEEDDPQNENGYIRLDQRNIQRGLWMVDPVDGTGDRRYGQIGTPERKGYSILSSFLKEGVVEDSVVVRPAYEQTIVFDSGTIHVTNSEGNQVLTLERRSVNSEKVRINVRKAYPQVNFSSEFFEFATAYTDFEYEEIRCGGAGDSMSKLVLGELDLVVARKGDWKAWDTGPFDPMLNNLEGKFTDCDNNPLGGYISDDLWHHRGVIASIDRWDAHEAFVEAMKAYKEQRGEDLVIETPSNA